MTLSKIAQARKRLAKRAAEIPCPFLRAFALELASVTPNVDAVTLLDGAIEIAIKAEPAPKEREGSGSNLRIAFGDSGRDQWHSWCHVYGYSKGWNDKYRAANKAHRRHVADIPPSARPYPQPSPLASWPSQGSG